MHRPRNLVNNQLLLALTTSALVMSPIVAGAVVIPDTARPENIQRQLQINTQRPELSKNQIITVQEQGGGKELKGNIAFTLKSVRFEGSKNLNPNDLIQFYKDKLGKSVTLNELNKMAASVTSHYRNEGFILTRAVVPPQRIENGIVTVRVIEGFVSDVQLKGDVGNPNSILYSYAEKIKQAKPLDAETLERYLLLMEDLPGVEARAVIQPSSTTPGASQVVVNIKRNKFEGSTAVLNNRGTRYLGPVQATGVLAVNNLMQQDEQTSLRVINTIFYPDELKYFGARHEHAVGSYGTKVVLDGEFVATKPGYTLEAFDVTGENYKLEASVLHPILRSRQANWFVNSDFYMQRVNLSSFKTNVYQDHLRVLTLGSAYDFIDQLNAVNRMEGVVSKGFSWGTSNNGLAHSRANGESSFVKFNANATRVQPITGPWAATLSVEGQYSLDPLYAAEEYALGGQRFGSAFDPAEISGDSGIAGRIELQYNGTSDYQYLPTYQPYVFYDIGEVWNRNILAASEAKSASLASTGVGARFNMSDTLTGSMEYATPLTRSVAAGSGDGYAPRFFFNLQYRY